MKQLAQRILDYLQSLGRKNEPQQEVKKQNPESFNVHHPEFIDLVEPASKENGELFQVDGVQYYRFKKDVTVPYGRYMYMQVFLYEQSLRMDLDTLNGYIQKMKYAVNGSVKTGIDLITVIRTLTQMESRVELAFEVDTTYRLASVHYFDDTEDLYTYDKVHNDAKIALWKGAKVVDFFYQRPMGELLGLSNFSPIDLQTFIEQQTKLLKELTIETPAQ
jgi:hypothetical protein